MADDDDWVGEPPEGRHTRDRAKPQHWANQWQAAVAGSILFFLLLALALILRLSGGAPAREGARARGGQRRGVRGAPLPRGLRADARDPDRALEVHPPL